MSERVAINPTRAKFHYSRLVKVGDLLFLAGHVARENGVGGIIGTTIQEQTASILQQFAATLEAAGSSLDKVVKVNVFLGRKEDFAAFNATYAEFFPEAPPVRTTVLAELLPEGALIEMDAIAST